MSVVPVPSGRICLGCGALVVGMTAERCDTCTRAHTDDMARRRKALRTRGAKRDTPRKRARDAIYRDPRWREVRARVIQRDGGCVLCGGDRQLSVHHRIPVLDAPALAFDPAYLVTLCRVCHGKVDGGRAHMPRTRKPARSGDADAASARGGDA